MAGPMRHAVLNVLGASSRPLSIWEIARRIGHHTNTPWSVVAVCRALEGEGRVTVDKTGKRWRYALVVAERTAVVGAERGERAG